MSPRSTFSTDGMSGDVKKTGSGYIDYDKAVKYYGKAVADKLAAQGKIGSAANKPPALAPPPQTSAPSTKSSSVPKPPAVKTESGDIYGTPEQIRDRLMKRYSSGDIPGNLSAEIVEDPRRPGQQMIRYSETPAGQESMIKYYAPVQVEDTQPMPAGQTKFTYSVGVEFPEQEEEIRKWAGPKGLTVRRDYSEEAQAKAPISLVISSDKELPADTSVDIQSAEAVRGSRVMKSAQGIGRQVYEKASPIEKAMYNIRTLLSPAGYEYVGAVARSPASIMFQGPSGLAMLPVVDYIFPNIKSPTEVVTQDIERRLGEQAAGKKTMFLGVEIPEAVVSAVNNPVVEVETMFLGGAGVAKIAATTLGGKLIGSTAGKIGSAILTGGYAVEKIAEVQQARISGNSTEALGRAVTTVAGFGASVAGFKAQYSRIISARAQHTIKVDISKVVGASESKRTEGDVLTGSGRAIKEGSTVSRGKFRIVEGELKGLKGETYSISGDRTGKLYTHIPKQEIGAGKTKIEVPEQQFQAMTRFGTVSEKLKLYWREAGNALVGQGKKSKIFGPNKEQSLMREVSSRAGTVTVTTDMGGAKVGVAKQGIVREFTGISSGKTARKYDLYVIQQGGKLVFAEKSVVGRVSLAKIDWVDVTYTPGGGAAMDVYAGGAVKVVPSTTVKLAPPAIPTALNVKVASQAAIAAAPRLVWSANPTPGPGVMLKRMQKVETIKIDVGAPLIIRTTTKQQERTGTVVQRTGTRTIAIPDIARTTAGLATKIEKAGAVLEVTHPITGQKVSQKERTAVLQRLNPIISRIANQPVNVPVTPNTMPAIVIPSLGLYPFLRMGPYSVRIEKFGRGEIKNPVPNIERLI